MENKISYARLFLASFYRGSNFIFLRENFNLNLYNFSLSQVKSRVITEHTDGEG